MVGKRVDIYGWLQLHYLSQVGIRNGEVVRWWVKGLISVDGYSYIT